jgi:hypothetical protein
MHSYTAVASIARACEREAVAAFIRGLGVAEQIAVAVENKP